MIKEELRFDQNNIFEGIVSLRALITCYNSTYNQRKILSVYYDIEKSEKNIKEYSWLKHRANEFSFDLILKSREEIDKIAIGSSHGGIIALCSDRELLNVSDDIVLNKNGFYIMLDGIEDPYNFGYALRSLYAAGCDGIILRKRNWLSAAGVVCRASAGASEYLPTYVCDNIEDAAIIFKKNGYKIVCSDLRDSVSLFEADLKKPLFLIIGGEKRGISRSVLNLSDLNVKIDYARDINTSLSAASAATVVGFEVYRQNR